MAYRGIFVPTDLSASGEEAARAAAEWAHRLGAALTLLRVVSEDEPEARASERIPPRPLDLLRQELERELMAHFLRVVPAAVREELQGEPLVRGGLAGADPPNGTAHRGRCDRDDHAWTHEPGPDAPAPRRRPRDPPGPLRGAARAPAGGRGAWPAGSARTARSPRRRGARGQHPPPAPPGPGKHGGGRSSVEEVRACPCGSAPPAFWRSSPPFPRPGAPRSRGGFGRGGRRSP